MKKIVMLTLVIYMAMYVADVHAQNGTKDIENVVDNNTNGTSHIVDNGTYTNDITISDKNGESINGKNMPKVSIKIYRKPRKSQTEVILLLSIIIVIIIIYILKRKDM